MRNQWYKKDGRVAEFIVKLAEYQLAVIPEEEVLQGKYRLSDLFFKRMEDLLRKQERKAKQRTVMRCTGVTAAVLLIFFWLWCMLRFIL